MRLFTLLKRIFSKILDIISLLNKKAEFTMLWENPTPSANFPAQEMSFDGDYDLVIILGAYSVSYPQVMWVCIVPVTAAAISAVANGFWQFGVVRPVSTLKTAMSSTASDIIEITTEVAFGVGQIYNTYGASATVNNGYCIPRFIYGVKFTNQP